MWGVYEHQIGEGGLSFTERHVMPMFGREHIKSMDCWCKPRRDTNEPTVVIHEGEN